MTESRHLRDQTFLQDKRNKLPTNTEYISGAVSTRISVANTRRGKFHICNLLHRGRLRKGRQQNYFARGCVSSYTRCTCPTVSWV